MPEPVDEPIPDTERAPCALHVAREALDRAVAPLGADEVLVLARIAERLTMGAKVYGLLQLATDSRDFRGQEAREEIEDALVYLACAWLKTEPHLEVTR
jgi:hypothetical protein